MFDFSYFDKLEHDETFEGFDPSEVGVIVSEYVCSQCYGTLTAYHIPNAREYLVFCLNCGESIHKLGTVTRTTVSIRYEQARREYKLVVSNLRDLYPDLYEQINTPPTMREGETREQANIRELGF